MRSPSPSSGGRLSTRNLRSISTPRGEVSAIGMEHYAPWPPPRSIFCCPIRAIAPPRWRCSPSGSSSRWAGRASADRVLLDTFDGRLREAGLRAERPAGRTGGAALTLHEPGAPAAAPRSARAARPWHALPPGPLRERLAGVLEERALLPSARVRSRRAPLAVRQRRRQDRRPARRSSSPRRS